MGRTHDHRAAPSVSADRSRGSGSLVRHVRPAGLPLPLPDELERRRLLDRLEARWQHPVTVVVAGAGFGKSTLLAQAVRANALEPKGIDVWHGCTPGRCRCRRARRRAARGPRRRRPASRSRWRSSPTRSPGTHRSTCASCSTTRTRSRPGSSGADLVGRARASPARERAPGARRPTRTAGCPVTAAGRRSSGRDLAGRSACSPATRRTCSPPASGEIREAADALGGWPALVRLALAARPDVAIDFAQEEVLSRLSSRAAPNAVRPGEPRLRRPRSRRGTSSALTSTSTHWRRRFPSSHAPRTACSAPTICGRTALAAACSTREETTELRTRVVDQLVADGDLARAGTMAVAHDDLDALGEDRACEVVTPHHRGAADRHACGRGSGAQRGRPGRARRPGCCKRRSVRRSTSPTSSSTPTSTPRSRASGPAATPTARSWRSSVGTVAAYARGDIARLVALAAAGRSDPGCAATTRSSTSRCDSIAAVVAEMSGDLDDALGRAAAAHRSTACRRRSSDRRAGSSIHCLLLSGRADEAVDVARQTAGANRNDRRARYLSAIARWMAGEPAELLALGRPDGRLPGAHVPRRVRAPHGRRGDARLDRSSATTCTDSSRARIRPSRRDRPPTTPATPCSTPWPVRSAPSSTTTRRSRPRLRRSSVVAAHAGSPILDQHLRRFLPLGYVLDPRAAGPVGRAPRSARRTSRRGATSRLLVDLRAGRRPAPCDLDPGTGVHRASRCRGRSSWPAGCTPTAIRSGRSSAHGWSTRSPSPPGPSCATSPTGARSPVGRARRRTTCSAACRRCPTRRLEISVLGPLQVAFDGVAVAAAGAAPSSGPHAARPARGPRDAQPGAGDRPALAGLGRARRRPQPARDPHLPAPAARTGTADRRGLVPPPRRRRRRSRCTAPTTSSSTCGSCGGWSTTPTASRGLGDIDRTIALLSAATSWWRGDPLTDLGSVAGEEHEIERARLLQLGVRYWISASCGSPAARRRTHCSMPNERSPSIRTRSEPTAWPSPRRCAGTTRSAPSVVADRAMAMLDELGVDPEPATKILLRLAS